MKKKLHRYFLLLLLGSCLTTKLIAQNIQRVRIDFSVPGKFTRHLLIGFTKDNSASDSYDYGYDALNRDSYPYDLSWKVDDRKCIIQGVGAFDDNKKYPLWLFMSKEEDFEISLDTTENFENPIAVFVFDATENTYTKINESNFKSHVGKGEYTNRFYLAFQSENTTSSSSVAKTLSTEDEILKNTKIQYLKNSKELYINTNGLATIKEIALTNVSGQRLFTSKSINNRSLKMPINQMTNQLVFVNVITDIGQTTKQLIIH
ncbi:hypothetical protein [Aestuariibaculum lutulentum]|uniref:T9SS C-terminal target domain-containing protein n=1 Tax=Aestuariibaculum lutulentum TaxID=2920935 RepID=A0ABS9RHW7_9FLAO|nr:hypothetical protein [Aestuariibaculum lutulentum]MCH4552524.1 hypothetical protein [Aestuariibaculum lutulentum]